MTSRDSRLLMAALLGLTVAACSRGDPDPGARACLSYNELRQPFFTRAPQGWIPDLIVTEAARGRHIGAALLDAAFARAREGGAYAVALESGHHRAVAHQLYLAAGMSDVGAFAWLDR